jgi:deoxyribodipyrimidine photolyase
MSYKISIVSKTFRLHDNPFLDSDIYVIFIDKLEYGPTQLNFLNAILSLHVDDLKQKNIVPVIVNSLSNVVKFIKQNKDIEFDVYTDYISGRKKFPVDNVILVPSWSLIDWNGKENMIREWFLPEALSNHNVFKKYVHKNVRSEFKTHKKQNKTLNVKILSSHKIKRLNDLPLVLPKKNLDRWIRNELSKKKFMLSNKWEKPKTSASVALSDDLNIVPLINQGSKLSPFVALGVISPLLMYKFFKGETRTGSSRDQLLFREMFHAMGYLPEFWNDGFGKKYKWETVNKKKFDDFIKGTTEHNDVNFAMKLLKKEGWIHHLARHVVADYLCRGTLKYHWKYGERWFKYSLIDHDDCVNRGNWMWLSGTAFSSKQRSFYHYNPDNYIQNLDKKLKIK